MLLRIWIQLFVCCWRWEEQFLQVLSGLLHGFFTIFMQYFMFRRVCAPKMACNMKLAKVLRVLNEEKYV